MLVAVARRWRDLLDSLYKEMRNVNINLQDISYNIWTWSGGLASNWTWKSLSSDRTEGKKPKNIKYMYTFSKLK